jgi:polysaccharide biosynthesis/export protein
MIFRRVVSISAIFALLSSCAGSPSGNVAGNNPVPLQAPSLKGNNSSIPGSSFVLGEGDGIEVNVWRQDTLKRAVRVDSSGNIVLPLIGEIKVAGLTVQETNEEVAKRLSRYFVDPQVDIRVTEVVSQKVYLVGEVSNPGFFVLDHKISVWELLAKGGFTKDADIGKVILISNNFPTAETQPRSKVSMLDLDFSSMEEQPPPVASANLQNGDIIYVPPRRMESGARFGIRVGSILAPIIGWQSAILLVPEIINVITGTDESSTQGGVIIGR